MSGIEIISLIAALPIAPIFGWALLTISKHSSRINVLEARMTYLDQKMEDMNDKMEDIDSKVNNISQLQVRILTQIESIKEQLS